PADPVVDGGLKHVFRADDIGLDRFHRVKLAGWHLLERGGVEDEIYSPRRRQHAGRIAHIADIEFELVAAELLALVVLLLLVTAEHANFADAGIEEPAQDGIAERAGTTGDQQGLAVERAWL